MAPSAGTRSSCPVPGPSRSPRLGPSHAVEVGRYRVNIDRTFELDEIADAHRYMEANRGFGKLVVMTPDD